MSVDLLTPHGITLRPYQDKAVDRVFQEFEAGRKSTLLVLPTGCHHPDQGILMRDGKVKRAADVQVGDVLIGPDSGPRNVLCLHAGHDEMFRVIPTKGEPFVVNGDHILSLARTNEKAAPKYPCQRRGGEIVDVTVRDWIKWPKWKKHIHKLFRAAVDFEAADDWGFDSYFMGLLLGDGGLSSRAVGVTTADPEIVEYMEHAADSLSALGFKLRSHQAGGISRSYYLSRNAKGRSRASILISALERMGLMGKTCGTKYIPHEFKARDSGDRLALLAGLMDSDGHLTCNGYDFISKSPRLSADVAFVARSVGLAAYVTPCEKRDQNGNGGTYYRVSISGEVSRIPCRIVRKRAATRQQKKSVLRTGFTVESIGVGEYRGFTVDGDNRYLMDDFTVTHNCGKTSVFCELARLTIGMGQGRVLVLAHREELIKQAAGRMAEHGVESAIEKADQHARSAFFGDVECVVASVQSMQGKRLRSWEPGYFKLVVVDEAHHRVATSYCNVLDWLRPDWELGVTATADRGDDEPIVGEGQVYQSLAMEYLITQAIKDGYLCPIEAVCCPTDIDLTSIRTTAGDLNAADLEEAITPHIEELVNVAKPHLIGGRSIVFAPDVGSADAVASALTAVGIPAESISGDTRNREEILSGFRHGDYRALVNCNLLTEGFDAPFISRVVLMRPTESRALQAQMIGRGTRIYPGKEKCLIVGFNWKTFKHKLCHPVELVDNYGADRETLDIAKELIASGDEPDLLRAIERAEGMKVERVKLRVKVREREARNKRVVRFDPLAVADTLGIPVRHTGERQAGVPATDKQIQTLQKFGVQAEGMGRRQASQYLDAIFARLRGGMATVKQVSWLIARGVDPAVARGMSKDEATEKLDELFGKRRVS